MLGATRGGDQEALAERARLQKLLEAYETSCITHWDEDDRGDFDAEVTPDRAENGRARIARLDQVIAELDDQASQREAPR